MPFYDYYDDDYLSTRMENCHLDEALYNEHRRRLEQARRFKRVLKNAKTREREAGKREGKEEGKAEGREEVMGMQRVWDGGVEWARKNDGRGGSQVQKAISAAPPASSHHKSRALLEAPSKAPSVTPSARENIEKFVREQQSRSSVASSARPSAHLSAQQHRSASHAPSRAPSRPMGYGAFSQQPARRSGYSRGVPSGTVSPVDSVSQLSMNFVAQKQQHTRRH